MNEQNPNNFLTQLEEFYNISSPSYKFNFKCDKFQINSKEDLLKRHVQQKQIVVYLHRKMKEMNTKKENIVLLRNRVESKFHKIVSLKRNSISDCNDIVFNKPKINVRKGLVLNEKYMSVLKDLNDLLTKLEKGLKE